MTEQPNYKRAYLIKTLILGGSYFITGQLGLLFSIPPGFATTVWPASGVALAGILLLGYRFWPGVFAGSFCVNVLLAANADNSQALLNGILTATTIAAGAALQAMTGAWLARRVITFPNVLEQAKDIFALLALGGPISCLVNATISTTTLAACGATTWEQYTTNWFVWWAGDTAGVLVFTPILLLLFVRDTTVTTRRKMGVACVLSSLFLLTASLFVAAKRTDHNQRQLEFDKHAASISSGLETQILAYMNILVAIDSYFRSSQYVSYEEFRVFTQKFFETYPDIQALSWNQRVTDTQRDAFEASVRKQGYGQFIIKDQFSLGNSASAPRRDQYFPVTYVVPYEGNEKAHGYDTYKESQRGETLDEARDAGKTRTTGRITVVQDEKNRYGLLIYHPVYSRDLKDTAIENRRKYLIGYSAAVFLIPQMVEKAIQDAKHHRIDLVLQDVSEPNDPQLLFDSRTTDYKESSQPLPVQTQSLQWSTGIDIAGRACEIRLIAGQTYWAVGPRWAVWSVLIGGLLFTGLFGVFMLTLTARTDMVQRLVVYKTDDLQRANAALASEVAERKQAEERVRESKDKAQAVLDTAPDAIIAINQDGCIESINRAGENIFGYTAQELIGNNVNMLMPSPYQEEHDGYLGAYLRTGVKKIIGVGQEVEGRHKDGSIFPIYLSVGEFKRGGRSYFTGVVQDISDRKRAEELLRASERRFDLAVRGTSDGLWDWNIETNEVWYAPRFKAMLGYEGDEFPHTFASFESHLHPEDKKDAFEAIRQHLEENQLYDVEYRLKNKDGEYEWFRARGMAQRDEAGKPVRMAGSIQDIHDQKIGQDEISRYAGDLWRAGEEIKASQKRFELAVDGTSDGLWDWLDVTKEDEWWSPRFYELLGYHDGEIDASLSQFKKLLHPDDLNRTVEAMRAHLEEDEPFDIAYRLKTKPGQYRWFRARGKTVRDRSGKALRMAGSIQDITDGKNAEEELAHWAEELEKSNKELDDFAYIASHDLKEPLRGIHNYATFLIEDYEGTIDEDGMAKLVTLQRLTQRMEVLIDTLLQYSRVGRVDMAFEETDLNQVLNEVVDSLHVTLDQDNVEVRTPTLLPTIPCDRWIGEVFRNLVTNAMKYNDKPDKWIEVGVVDSPLGNGGPEADRGEDGKADTDSQQVFYVQDNGIGIPEKHRDSIFRIFKRLHGREKFGGGTGAGLTIVKKIVERHGGRVWFESRHGQGTTFKFTLGKAA